MSVDPNPKSNDSERLLTDSEKVETMNDIAVKIQNVNKILFYF